MKEIVILPPSTQNKPAENENTVSNERIIKERSLQSHFTNKTRQQTAAVQVSLVFQTVYT